MRTWKPRKQTRKIVVQVCNAWKSSIMASWVNALLVFVLYVEKVNGHAQVISSRRKSSCSKIRGIRTVCVACTPGLSEREDSASQQEGAVEDALFYTLCNAEVRMFLYLLQLQELGAVAKMEAESMSGAMESLRLIALTVSICIVMIYSFSIHLNKKLNASGIWS
nr:probable protein S-acyltransferase 19 [Ipomoea batatas]